MIAWAPKADVTFCVLSGWVAPCEKTVASGLIRWSLAFAFVAKKQLRVEEVRSHRFISELILEIED